MNGLITGTVHDMSRLCTSCLKLDNLKPPCDPAQDNLVRTMDGLPDSMQCQFVTGFFWGVVTHMYHPAEVPESG